MDLAGADEATLTITDVRLVHAGDYRVTVSDRTGSVTSAVAKLTVSPSPIGPTGFVWIPPGDFVMGSPKDEPFRLPNEAQHTVKLTNGFWMSDHEVTNAEFEEVMKSGSSSPKDERNFPVAWVNWEEALKYYATLTARERAAGRLAVDQTYRLPTKAEWKYAARAGTAGPRYGSLDDIAWHSSNSMGGTHPVMKKLPNAWGLHDMIGNVWEWCADWYENYPMDDVTDPRVPASGSLRVLREGDFGFDQRNARVAFRTGVAPLVRQAGFGFRVVLSSER